MFYGAFYTDMASLFGYNKSFSQNLFLLPQSPHWRGIIFLKPQRFCTALCLISSLPPLHHFLLPPNLCCFLSPFIAILIPAPSRPGSENTSHNGKFPVSPPRLEAKRASRPVYILFEVCVSVMLTGRYLTAHRTYPFLMDLLSANVQFPNHAPGLSQEQTVKTIHEC